MEMPVSFAQAALGAEIEVPTIDGRVKLTIPEGTQPGSVFPSARQGHPVPAEQGRRPRRPVRHDHGHRAEEYDSRAEGRLHAYAESMNEAVSDARSGIFGNKKKR